MTDVNSKIKGGASFIGAQGRVKHARAARPWLDGAWHCLLSSWFWLGLMGFTCLALTIIPIQLPVGGYYWDVYFYPDAAWRIANGQIPHVDFFAPAGALAYYSYALLERIFPNGHFVLLSQWSLLLVTLPMMMWINAGIAPRNRMLALAIILPFVFFSFVPLNSKEIYANAGVDGYGMYNRHSCILLYVLVTTILFVPRGLKPALLAGLILTAVFFTKITGAVIAMGIIAHAVLAGRLSFLQLAQVVKHLRGTKQ